jgi:hypothetical protein
VRDCDKRREGCDIYDCMRQKTERKEKVSFRQGILRLDCLVSHVFRVLSAEQETIIFGVCGEYNAA